jgi:hypothetical protein
MNINSDFKVMLVFKSKYPQFRCPVDMDQQTSQLACNCALVQSGGENIFGILFVLLGGRDFLVLTVRWLASNGV